MKKNSTPDRPRLNALSTTALRCGSATIPMVPAWKPKTSSAATHRKPVSDGRRGARVTVGALVIPGTLPPEYRDVPGEPTAAGSLRGGG